MANTVVIGAQWGDEGKAKIVDIFSETADIIVRYQGGANAGHTVVWGDRKFVFHLVPTGMLHHNKTCLIGNGVVVDVAELFKELDQLEAQGIRTKGRIKVSSNAHVVLPFHKQLDASFEDAADSKKIGTTKRGIGPTYADKIGRIGVRVGELFQPAIFKQRLETNLKTKNLSLQHLYNIPPVSVAEIFDYYQPLLPRLQEMVIDSMIFLHQEIASGKTVLFEGAQGTLLDIDFGAYPYLTSSNPSIGGVFTGTGINPSQLQHIVGIVKAYQTRVGTGPFPTELSDDVGEKIRTLGAEYGATTGRPRRCGWLDLVSLRFSAQLNGFTQLALTKADILDHFKEIPICKKYKLGSQIIDFHPSDTETLAKCEPVYERLPGWHKPIKGLTTYSHLDDNFKRYLHEIEEFMGCPIKIISTGAAREETIFTP